jgi:hypothetical protein
MYDRFQSEVPDARRPDVAAGFPPLPPWLAGRLLWSGEAVTWVVGPRFSPPWERWVTHPALFLAALALGGLCLGAGWLTAEAGSEVTVAALAAGGIVIGSVFVLGLSCGYFTRLVVTNCRLVILQGYEVCRSWGLDKLPRSLLRYRGRGQEEWARTVDLEALTTMLGGPSSRFADAKTILAFGKQLDRITHRDPGEAR